MPTAAEIQQASRYRGGRTPYTPAPNPVTPVQAPTNSISFERQIPINAAYQKLMRYGQESDLATGQNRRNLTTNLDNSQKNRGNSLLNSRQGLADRGIMNSGIALKRMEDLNQGYDTTDSQMVGNFEANLAEIARQKLGLGQDYEDAKVQGSYLTTQDQTLAEDERLQNTLAREEQSAIAWREEQQRATLIAALQAQIQAPAPTNYPEPIPEAPVDTSYADAANAYAAALARNKKKPPNKKTQPKLIRGKGPQ